MLAVAGFAWGALQVGLWVYSGYSFVQAIKNKDWLGAVISGIGFFIPPKAAASVGATVLRGVLPKIANSRAVSNIARAMNGVMRGAGAGARTATVATTASNTVRSGSAAIKVAGKVGGGSISRMAGSGGRVGSGLSGVGGGISGAGGIARVGNSVSSAPRYLLTGNGLSTLRLTGATTLSKYINGGRTVSSPAFNSFRHATLTNKIVAETKTILNSSAFNNIRAAHNAGESVTVNINGRIIQYEPINASGMTLFGENGFIIGREAFASSAETTKTLLHELYRLNTSQSANGVYGSLVTQETKSAYNFAERVFKEFFK